MLPKTFRRAAAVSLVALAPLVAANAALAADTDSAIQHGSRHDDLGRRLLSEFEVPAGATKAIIVGGEPEMYRVCADAQNKGSVSVHFEPNKQKALSPGQCEQFETGKLSIENSAKTGTAYGTYQGGLL